MNALQFEIQNTTCRIQMPNSLAAIEAEALKNTYPKICQSHPEVKQIALDFGETGFMDGRGLGALVSLYKTTRCQAIDLLLEEVSSQVLLVLALTGLEQEFTIQPLNPS